MLRVLHLLMEFKGHTYAVSVQVLLTVDEVATLMELSAAHYDGHCKSAGEVGGFLYRLREQREWLGASGTPTAALLSWSEVDTLVKILEGRRTFSESDLYVVMREMLRGMALAERKANGPPA